MVWWHKKGVKILKWEQMYIFLDLFGHSFGFASNLVSCDNRRKGFMKRKGRLTKCAPIALFGRVR